jgi:DNA-binding transcriptional LysR family regulator
MEQSEIDLNALQVLLEVVSAGSFSAAARHRGVPPNRLSRQVQVLEQSLGVRLLQRTTRRLSLTGIGHTLLDRATPALLELESLWRQAGAQAEEPRGHLRVAAPADLMAAVSAQHLAHFLDLYPLISLEILLSDEQVDLYSSGIDLAFRAGPIRDEGLVARQLMKSPLIVVASPACVIAHGHPTVPDALAVYPCLASHSKGGRCVWSLTGPQGQTAVTVRARLTINGMGALVSTAREGLGAALVPERLVKQELASGALLRLLPEYGFDGGGIFIVYPSRRHPSAALRAFIDFAVQHADTVQSE